MPFIEQQLSADGVTTEGRFILTEAIYEAIINDHVSTMTVSATVPSPQASGYAVGDTFRLNAGTPVVVNGDSFHATGRVTAVDSPDTGNPTAVEIISWGAYTALPAQSPISSPEGTVLAVATTVLTGAGSGDLLVDITTDTAKWTSDSYVTDSHRSKQRTLRQSVDGHNSPGRTTASGCKLLHPIPEFCRGRISRERRQQIRSTSLSRTKTRRYTYRRRNDASTS